MAFSSLAELNSFSCKNIWKKDFKTLIMQKNLMRLMLFCAFNKIFAIAFKGIFYCCSKRLMRHSWFIFKHCEICPRSGWDLYPCLHISDFWICCPPNIFFKWPLLSYIERCKYVKRMTQCVESLLFVQKLKLMKILQKKSIWIFEHKLTIFNGKKSEIF